MGDFRQTWEVVIVAGHEGTGTQWMAWSLHLHPDIEHVMHQTYPTRFKDSPYLRLHEYAYRTEWAQFASVKYRTAPLVVMMRDQHCSHASNIRRGFYRMDPNRPSRAAASQELHEDVDAWQGKVLFVSYEGLVEEKDWYYRWVLRQLDVDPDRFPWDEFHRRFGFRDANAKYFHG